MALYEEDIKSTKSINHETPVNMHTPMNGKDEHGRNIDALKYDKFHRMDGCDRKCCRLLIRMMEFVKILIEKWHVENPVAPIRNVILKFFKVY